VDRANAVAAAYDPWMTADGRATKLPWRVTMLALALAASVALPLSAAEGTTLLRVILESLRNDWLGGLLFAIVFGAPHGFALAAAWASRTGGAYAGAAVRAWVALLQTEVVVIGLLVLRNLDEGNVRAPFAIIGFAAITAMFFAHRVASPDVPPHRRDTGFFARWGALLVVGVFGWLELQWIGGDAAPGPWLHATLAAAFGLAASVPRDR
jgi:hypothetical protein